MHAVEMHACMQWRCMAPASKRLTPHAQQLTTEVCANTLSTKRHTCCLRRHRHRRVHLVEL